MNIHGLKLIKMGSSRGFFIPVQYCEKRMAGGLKEGTVYDLVIEEAREE